MLISFATTMTTIHKRIGVSFGGDSAALDPLRCAPRQQHRTRSCNDRATVPASGQRWV